MEFTKLHGLLDSTRMCNAHFKAKKETKNPIINLLFQQYLPEKWKIRHTVWAARNKLLFQQNNMIKLINIYIFIFFSMNIYTFNATNKFPLYLHQSSSRLIKIFLFCFHLVSCFTASNSQKPFSEPNKSCFDLMNICRYQVIFCHLH